MVRPKPGTHAGAITGSGEIRVKHTVKGPTDQSQLMHFQRLSRLGETFGGWKIWDKNVPPSAGRYVVWDPYFSDGQERIWSYVDQTNRGWLEWRNESNWVADRAPYYYRALPCFPAKDRVREAIKRSEMQTP